MSWLANLVNIYDHCFDNPEFADDPHTLLPTDHVSPQAHIEVTIDGAGNFCSAAFIGKVATLIPATESSAGRASGLAPHGLSDGIQYLCEDYQRRGGGKQPGFTHYFQQLTDWCESKHSHPKAIAVYIYLKKGNLIEDLVTCKLFELDKEGCFKIDYESDEKPPELLRTLGKEKGQFKDPGSALIRWRVEIEGEHATTSANCWQDPSLINAWCDYLAAQNSDHQLCYITGKMSVSGSNHPKFIRRPGDSAKLISVPSGAEKSGALKGFYAFKGRFTTPDEACTLGWIASQKAHNALRWLIARQGYKHSEQVIVSWESCGSRLPGLIASTADAFEEDELWLDDLDDIDFGFDAGQSFARNLNKKISGYRSKLGDTSQVVTMAMEAATPGRLSITFYRELAGSEYLDRIERWHWQFSWFLRVSVNDQGSPGGRRTCWLYSAPSPADIAEAAYGRGLDDSLKSATIKRLLPCILNDLPLPRDLMEQAVRRASNPTGFKQNEKWQWEKTLGIACALVRGFNQLPDDFREHKMTFNFDNKSRDYLYGCLLAVAENIETFALRVADEQRPTNAERVMYRFSQRPYSTWPVIEHAIAPYAERLARSERHKWFIAKRKSQLDEIFQQLEETGGFTEDLPLEGEYLLGYHCLRGYLTSKKEQSTTSTNENEGMKNAEE